MQAQSVQTITEYTSSNDTMMLPKGSLLHPIKKHFFFITETFRFLKKRKHRDVDQINTWLSNHLISIYVFYHFVKAVLWIFMLENNIKVFGENRDVSSSMGAISSLMKLHKRGKP